MNASRILLALTLAAPSAAAQVTLPPVPVPLANPITADKAELGRVLFWEEQLSSTSTMACGTCHIPSAGGGDPRAAAIHPGLDGVFGTADDAKGSAGVVLNNADGTYDMHALFGMNEQATTRNSPSMINAAFSSSLFWDGRAEEVFRDPVTNTVLFAEDAALESQAAGPPVSDVEMGNVGQSWADIEARITAATPLALASDLPAATQAFINGRSYPDLFNLAFGTPDVTAARIAAAIATYERTLISDETPLDLGTLTPQEQSGFALFLGLGQCAQCHTGPTMTDDLFHNVGVRQPDEDIGREAVTGIVEDRGKFRTPQLRNVELTAPYFHDGSSPTLEEVVLFYNRGGDVATNRSPLIQPLGLNPTQRADLVAFLRTGLLDQRVVNETGPFERPTLFSESSRRPSSFGVATAGSGGFEPQMVALEPPRIGNPSMTVGIAGANGGSLAYLLSDFGSNPGGITILGAQLYYGFTPEMISLYSGLTQGALPGEGWDSVSLAVPNDTELLGLTLTMQWVVFDPGSAGGLAATSATDIAFF